MIWSLVRKELRQHWLAFLLVAGAAMSGDAILIMTGFVDGRAGSAFESWRIFVAIMGLLTATVLCHRLVVTEYQARTQLFLETLPLSRWHMVAVKYGLGLGVLLLILGLAFGLTCVLASQRQLLTVRFLGILAARAFTAAWFAYNLFFLMGLLGRYRTACYIAAFLVVAVLSDSTELHLNRFGPIALLDERFPYEKDLFPWEALRTTWVLGCVFVILAGLLSLTREGSVAALLAEKMSHREKVFIAALLVGVVCAFALLSEKKKRAPFDLAGAVTEQRRGVVVQVAADGKGGHPSTQLLAAQLAEELEEVRDYLALDRLPPVFLTPRDDLDANRYERGELEKAEGVHVQANFQATNWQSGHFLAWLLREVLIEASNERAKLESKAWVLDGFALYWAQRKRPDAPLTSDRALALRALYGTEQGFVPRDLRCWLSFRERVGEEIAAGVAWSGLRTLARRQGPDRCQRFLRGVLGTKVRKDIRALWHERTAPVEHLLKDEAGLGLQPFFAQWQAELVGARRSLSNELAQVPRLRGQVRFVPLSAESRQLRYRVALDRAPERPARYSFLHHELPFFNEEVESRSIRREQHTYDPQAENELPETFSRGARLYCTFALEVPALGCEVVSGWTRQEVK